MAKYKLFSLYIFFVVVKFNLLLTHGHILSRKYCITFAFRYSAINHDRKARSLIPQTVCDCCCRISVKVIISLFFCVPLQNKKYSKLQKTDLGIVRFSLDYRGKFYLTNNHVTADISPLLVSLTKVYCLFAILLWWFHLEFTTFFRGSARSANPDRWKSWPSPERYKV